MCVRRSWSAPWGRVLVFFAIVCTALPAAGEARRQEAGGPERVIVKLALQLGSAPAVVVAVPENELVTIHHELLDYGIALRPRLGEWQPDEVEIDILEPPHRQGQAPGQVLDQLRGRVGFESVTSANGMPLVIRVLAAGEELRSRLSCGSAMQPMLAPAPDEPAPLMAVGCCITCMGTRYCSCGVQTPCGSCNGC